MESYENSNSVLSRFRKIASFKFGDNKVQFGKLNNTQKFNKIFSSNIVI